MMYASQPAPNLSIPSLMNSPFFENLQKSADPLSGDATSNVAVRGGSEMDLSSTFSRNTNRDGLNSNAAQSLGMTVSQLLQRKEAKEVDEKGISGDSGKESRSS